MVEEIKRAETRNRFSSMDRTSENSVVVYRASDELEARLIVSILRENGIESMLRIPESPPYDGLEMMWLGGKLGEIRVLERDFDKAKELIKDNII